MVPARMRLFCHRHDGDGVVTADQRANTPLIASVTTYGADYSWMMTTIRSAMTLISGSDPNRQTADATGCSPSQLDTDNDGVTDDLDQCQYIARCDGHYQDLGRSGSLKGDYIDDVHPLITDFRAALARAVTVKTMRFQWIDPLR